MTGKRFKLRLSKLGNGMITDTKKREDLYFDKEFLDVTLPKATEWLNTLNKENEQLKSKLLNIEEDRDYFKAKASSLEEGYLQLQDRGIRLKKENEQLKQKSIMLNKDLKYITDRKNYLESEWDKFYELIDKKIKKLEDKYEFGRTEYDACPMHNIKFGINVLKELIKELEE